MASKIVFGVLVAICVSSLVAGECNNPVVTSNSFTTQDATILSQIAFIAEFSLKCSNGDSGKTSLYAEVEGKLSPVARVGENSYQVSWNEEIKKARSGDYVVRLFDDDGYGALRKAQRSGGDVNAVKSLAKVVVRHPGAYNGPWINSELFATGLSFVIGYVAFTTRSKILS